jgi:hypothetical protein
MRPKPLPIILGTYIVGDKWQDSSSDEDERLNIDPRALEKGGFSDVEDLRALKTETIPLYRTLSKYVDCYIPLPTTFEDWGWPTTGALSSFSPAPFNAAT